MIDPKLHTNNLQIRQKDRKEERNNIEEPKIPYFEFN